MDQAEINYRRILTEQILKDLRIISNSPNGGKLLKTLAMQVETVREQVELSTEQQES